MKKSSKIPPHIKENLTRIRQELKGTKTIDQILNILQANGYVWVAGGTYKNVYRKGKDPLCVKVYKCPDNWKEDSYIIPPEIESYYLHPVYNNKRFIIQEWATHQKNKKVVSRLPKELFELNYDIRDDNVKFHRGKEVIIDFCNWED